MKTIAFITDIHLDENLLQEKGVDTRKQWELLLSDLATREIDHIVFGGDIGAASAYPWFFKTLNHFNLKYIIGNHDTFSEAAKYYIGELPAGNELYYSEKGKHYKYIYMDTSAGSISAAQLHWLKNKLVTDKPVILFIHHPILAVDTPIDRQYPLHGRDEIANVLKEIDEKVFVFCGHYHMEDILQSDNITQIITPASSYQIVKQAKDLEFDNTTFGYCILQLSAFKIQTQVVMSRNGKFEADTMNTFHLAH
ncbi:metallophosphoesterase [Mucilaginibacter pallidiroseus]|uniref:Metallophosphoesterase n=1 Tax=Mucilaginibacter pallidiroseus TaxID=2599295 RepID=A0A563UCX2_9SPHI|nr:metallophosphoesterase [Mucilaginibacter pallidiroseus]TWR29208.1 metallophosphoesterase [Mucilaginibacter pallidiroseus]